MTIHYFSLPRWTREFGEQLAEERDSGGESFRCPDCKGTGETECSHCGHESECSSCGGLGMLLYQEYKTLNFDEQMKCIEPLYDEQLLEDQARVRNYLPPKTKVTFKELV